MAMTIRLFRRNRQHFHIGNELPLYHREGARIGGGLFMVLFGGVFAGFPMLFAVQWLRNPSSFSGSATAAVVVLSVFLVIGVSAVVGGLNAWCHRYETGIDTSGVRGLRRGIRGTRTWHEPLLRYRGVLADEEYHSGGKNRSSYTLYKITLKHCADDDLDVLLYSSRSSAGHREEIEKFARLLDRPVLQKNGEGEFTERAVEDLDKSVRELVAEGKLLVAAIPSGPPPTRRLRIRPEANGYVIDLDYHSVQLVVMALLFGGIGSGLVYWYFGPGVTGGEGSPWVVPLVGGVFAIVGLVMFMFVLLGSSRLQVYPGGVRSRVLLAGIVVVNRSMGGDAIEEVIVHDGNRGQPTLRLRGDAGCMAFGGTLNRKALTYVRDVVIATLARR